jgi:hypothetical protein
MIGDRNGMVPDWRPEITRESDARCRVLMPEAYELMGQDRGFFVSVYQDDAPGLMAVIDRCERAGCKVIGHIGWAHHVVGPVTVVVFSTLGSADRIMRRLNRAAAAI